MMLRGHLFRAPAHADLYAPFPPMFSLEEQDAIAARYAAWWAAYYRSEGCAPNRAAAIAANLEGIGRSNWKVCMFHEYCQTAGLLVPPRLMRKPDTI